MPPRDQLVRSHGRNLFNKAWTDTGNRIRKGLGMIGNQLDLKAQTKPFLMESTSFNCNMALAEVADKLRVSSIESYMRHIIQDD